jgi:hypothetical protein
MARRRPRVDAVLLAASIDDPSWFDICKAAGVRLLAADRSDGWVLTT